MMTLGLLPSTSVGRRFSESFAEVAVRRTARVSTLRRHPSKKEFNNYDYVRPHLLPPLFILCSTLSKHFYVRTTPHYYCLAITVRKRPLGAHSLYLSRFRVH